LPTTSLVPTGLGRVVEDRLTNLSRRCSTCSSAAPGYHMNVNILNRDMLNFVRLTREQQMDVINWGLR
jgi:pyruvate-formate lyase